MIALQIADTGDFMHKMLTGSTFDKFYLLEGEVATFGTFAIDGALNDSFYSADEKEALQGRTFSLWGEMRPLIFQLMKGRKLPVRFKFVLQLSDENRDWLLCRHHLEALADQLKGLYLNIRYQDNKLTLVTGLSYKTFVMDKRLEHLWDETAVQFMKQSDIVVEQI